MVVPSFRSAVPTSRFVQRETSHPFRNTRATPAFVMKENVWSKPMTKPPPNSLDPGHIEGQNPATPERVLGHTRICAR